MKRPHLFRLAFAVFLFTCIPPLAIAQIGVPDDLRQIHIVERGATYAASLRVINRSDEAVTVRLYLRDRSPVRASYLDPGSVERSNAAWIQLNRSMVTIEPNDTAVIPYEIDVPPDQGLRGTYWGVIMVEPAPEMIVPSGEIQMDMEEIDDTPRIEIQQRVRFAVQVITLIGETGVTEVDFDSPQLKQDSERASLVFSINLSNNGETFVQATPYVDLYREDGEHVGRFDARQRNLLPTSSVQQEFFLGDLEPGRYEAIVFADAGDEDVFAVRYTLNVVPPEESSP